MIFIDFIHQNHSIDGEFRDWNFGTLFGIITFWNEASKYSAKQKHTLDSNDQIS